MRENAYFEELRFKEKNSAETYLFHHYSESLDYGCTVFRLSKLPFFCHIEFIVNTLRKAGITSVVITEANEHLFSILNEFARLGCSGFEPVTISRFTTWDTHRQNEREHFDGIRITL
jgi:hypothetical protein